MTVSDFQIEASFSCTADPGDLSDTGLVLSDEQQARLDVAKRLISVSADVLAVLESVAMGHPVDTDDVIEMLDFIRHGERLWP